MFNKAILDITTPQTPQQKRFYSCIRLVADSCISAAFYVNSDWSKQIVFDSTDIKREQLKRIIEMHDEFITAELRRKIQDILPDKEFNGESPRVICLANGSWDLPPDEYGSRPIETIGDSFVLSASGVVNQGVLLDQGLNPNMAILCLAAVGIDIILPNISIDILAEDEIAEIRANLAEERISYVNKVTEISKESFDAIKTGDFEEVIRWAKNEAIFSIAPKAREYEISVAKYKRKTLARAGFSIWKDGVPAIGAAYLSGGIIPAVSVAGAQVLQALVHATISGQNSTKVPEVSYGMKIRDLEKLKEK